MKRFFSILLTIFMAFVMFGCDAEEEEITRPSSYVHDNGFVFWYNNEKGYLYKYEGKDENVVIPSSFKYDKEDVPVEIIHLSAFERCSFLKSVVIPNGVTELEKYVFFDCTSLENITIPNTLTTVGDGVFSNCYSLEKVVFPEGVKSLGVALFYHCSALKEVVIPDSVINMEEATFTGCSSLTSVSLPSGITRIPHQIFSNCSSLETITIPNGVETIGESAFVLCVSLKEVVVPDTLKEIEENAFAGCELLDKLIIPSSVSKIHNHVFEPGTTIIHNDHTYNNPTITIFYDGDESDWEEIEIGSINTINANNLYFYSKYQPTEPGNFWHYVGGELVIWQ